MSLIRQIQNFSKGWIKADLETTSDDGTQMRGLPFPGEPQVIIQSDLLDYGGDTTRDPIAPSKYQDGLGPQLYPTDIKGASVQHRQLR